MLFLKQTFFRNITQHFPRHFQAQNVFPKGRLCIGSRLRIETIPLFNVFLRMGMLLGLPRVKVSTFSSRLFIPLAGRLSMLIISQRCFALARQFFVAAEYLKTILILLSVNDKAWEFDCLFQRWVSVQAPEYATSEVTNRWNIRFRMSFVLLERPATADFTSSFIT